MGIKNRGFNIFKEYSVFLKDSEIELIYKEDLKKAKEENFKRYEIIFNEYKRMYSRGPVLFLLVSHPSRNAIEYSCLLKGNHFNPAQCEPTTIRYKFRNKKWDKINIQKNQIIIPPADNVIHCPKNPMDLWPIIKRFFPEYYHKNL